MEFVAQNLNDIILSLQPLVVEWQDDTSRRVIAEIEALPVKTSYTDDDVKRFLDVHFDDGLLICRLFLGLSKDQFTGVLREAMKEAGHGVSSYRKNPEVFLEALVALGILEAMAEQTNRAPKWSDVLVERLRSGRGSAISGQKRGRGVEDFAEAIVRKIFGNNYACRCTFTGPRNKKAKSDIAIPSKTEPRILIEAKGYGATGSKMTDIIGDIEKIIAAKRSDTAFLFFTDGLTWKQRKSDLRKIVEYQNAGDITRIYSYALAHQFEPTYCN
ncbi:MAG TPA: DpnII family type II restriction endonuclease [Nitrospira sp.]|nr:DpnII family type II restriction endonuclease [Nitrospira sp.]